LTLDIEHEGEPPLSLIKRCIESADADKSLKQSFKTHYENLEQLAFNLRQLGMDESEIDEHVAAIFHEYQSELKHFLDSLRDRP